MAKLKIKFHPLFVVFVILLLFSNNILNVVSYILCVFLHELGHFIVAQNFGYKLNKISFMPFGASISGKENVFYSLKHEILVSVAGPMVNLILIIICLALFWLFPSLYFYLEPFYYANVMTLMFNFLPVYPLDGGRVLYALLKKKHKQEKAYKIIKIIGFIISIFLFVLFIISAFFEINYTFATVSLFLISGLFFEDTGCYYIQNYNFINKQEKLKKGMETNIVSINENACLYYALRKLNKYKFNTILVVSNSGKILKSLSEVELNNLLLNYDLDTKFCKVLKVKN